MKKKYFSYIDLFKFIFSICIVALHTEIFYNHINNFSWYIIHGIFRLAVPFFFVISGFFYCNKCLKDEIHVKNITKKYIRRLLSPFIFWLLLGLVISEFRITYQKNIIYTIMLLIKKVLFYPWGALWYISALIVSIAILSFFYKRKKYIEPLIIGSMLYVFALLSNSYYFVIINNHFLKFIIDKYMAFFISSRNGIFVGLLFVSLGGLISLLYNRYKLFSKKTNIIFLILSYIILLIEIKIVKNNIYADDHSLFLFLPIVMFFFCSLLLQIKGKKDYIKLRNMSIIIYFIHRPILSVINLYFNVKLGLLCFIIVCILSIIISFILIKINNKYVKKFTLT
ncbi:MAG: acyltransferase [Bacilli bacterium]|nr:acyltransferase [Bacilli bacterium]